MSGVSDWSDELSSNHFKTMGRMIENKVQTILLLSHKILLLVNNV